MQQIISWLSNNYRWLFDGLGGLIFMSIFGVTCRLIFPSKNKNMSQIQKTGKHSTNFQSGRDIILHYDVKGEK